MSEPQANPARWAIAAGGVFAALAVCAGAFGAHILENAFPPERLVTFETAARYHMYHALALILAGIMMRRSRARRLKAAALSFAFGIVVFSGSLYALVLTDTPQLGMITPFGGVAFIAGWGLLAWSGWRGARTGKSGTIPPSPPPLRRSA